MDRGSTRGGIGGRGRRSALVTLFALLLWAAAALDGPGCALEGTGGRAVLVEVELTSEPMQGTLGRARTLHSPGWTVTLDEATVVVGAVYLFPPRRETAALRPWGPARALAHAGDDNFFGVPARAEYLEAALHDALEPGARRLGRVVAEEGPLDVASVWLDEPRGELALASSPTRGHHAFVRGSAERDGRVIRFEAGIDLENTPLRRRVDNIPVEGDRFLGEGSVVRVAVRPDHWLQHVDFDLWLDEEAGAPDTDGVYRPRQPSLFHTGWMIGFHNRHAFRVETAPAGQAPSEP